MPSESQSGREDSQDLPAAPPRPRSADGSAGGVARLRQQLSKPDQPQAGDRLGRFVLQEKLGSGGMGTVFAACEDGRDERVALKIMDASFIQNSSALRRFRKEGVLLSKAESPFITRMLEINDSPPHPYIAAELVDGPNVGELLKTRRAFDEPLALQLTAQVAQALTDIADLDIIHRDIKPENILLAKNRSSKPLASDAAEFKAKLTDFGLARHTQQTHSMEMTRDNALLGTPIYMSPEQFADATHIDVRSDIYSLGATLFHMLAGQPPFAGNDIARLAEMHRHSPAPDLRISVPTVSDAASEVVRKCLQKRADLRYQTAADLLNDLQKVIAGEPISVTVHPLIPKSDRSNVIDFRNEWDMNASPAELWPFVSNTERLNRAIGLPAVRYTTQVVDEAVQTYAHVRIAGMNMKWQEHVFEWIEARRMGVLREFEFGPIKWFTSIVEFVPTVEGRTKLIHRFQVEPRNWFGRLFTAAKFGFETRRSLSKVYSRIDGVLANTKGRDPLVDAFEPQKRQAKKQQSQFADTIARVKQKPVSPNALLKVSEFAQLAPAQEAGRIRPLQLAENLQLPFEAVIEVMLQGTVAGLFELKWDVICPSCRISSQTYDLLQLVSDHEHCEACHIKYEVDLRNQVEAFFRVHPQLRDVDTGKYCTGGPAHSPHVVAQTRIRPDENVQLGLALSGGSYVIRGPQLPHQLKFQVTGDSKFLAENQNELNESPISAVDKTAIFTSDESFHTLEVERQNLLLNLAVASDWNQPNLRLGPGQQLVEVHNGFEKEMIVRVERASPRTDALTAAAILALPLFRELFPSQTFAKSQLAAISRITLLQTQSPPLSDLRKSLGPAADSHFYEHLQQLANLCAESRGTWIKMTDGGALMSFVDREDAIQCAKLASRCVVERKDDRAWQVSCAVVTGQAVISTFSGQLDYLGPPVEKLQSLLKTSPSGEVQIVDL